MTTLTTRAVEAIEGVSTRDAGRAKNLFALGVLSWLYGRPDRRHQALDRAEVRAQPRRWPQANLAAFNAGWSFGETTELLDVQYRVDAGDRRRRRAPTATSTGRPRCRWG